MPRNIVIQSLKRKPIEEVEVELCEHKGIGHPDTISDALCEAASRALSKYYLKEFGHIFHHNLDKGLLVAGKSEPKFNGGEIVEPIHITIAGRATNKIGDKLIPVDEIAIEAAHEYIHQKLTILEKDHVKIDAEIKQGSGDLQEVFTRSKGAPLANDTSFGVGYAPLSDTEILVLKTATLLNSREFKKQYPAVGDDIKVMGSRIKNKIILTISIAFVDRYIKNIKEYFEVKEKVKEALLENAKKLTQKEVNIQINTLDDEKGKKEADVYLTVTGLSAEVGDDGQVGRGNRTNCLITPCRPMSLEAAAGKNPTNHVGKIYNVLASLIANDIIEKVKNVMEVYVRLLSSIGKPIDQPQVADIEVLTKNNLDEQTKKEIYKIVDEWLANITKVTDMIIKEEVTLF